MVKRRFLVGPLRRLVGVDFDDADIAFQHVDHEIRALALQAAGKAAPLGSVRGVALIAPYAACGIVGIE